jgi:hypothetical protein
MRVRAYVDQVSDRNFWINQSARTSDNWTAWLYYFYDLEAIWKWSIGVQDIAVGASGPLACSSLLKLTA